MGGLKYLLAPLANARASFHGFDNDVAPGVACVCERAGADVALHASESESESGPCASRAFGLRLSPQAGQGLVRLRH